MTLDQFDSWQKSLKALKGRNRLFLLALATLMVLLWIFSHGMVSPRQNQLYRKVSDAEKVLYQWRDAQGNIDVTVDPFRTGLIGVEWSDLSTTEGALPSKRTAADPRWALVVDQWLDELDVKSGDSVVVMASSSFPGLILNTLMALENRGVEPLMVLSLGASSWGANQRDFTWLHMADHLRSRGLLQTMPRWCTLGGNGEIGGGLPGDTENYFIGLARQMEIPLVRKTSLEKMIQWKVDLIKSLAPKVVFSIGGSHANMGDDPAVLTLRPGLDRKNGRGDGVIGRSLAAGVPVVHLLDLKRLSQSKAIPYDGRPSPFFQSQYHGLVALTGLLLFALGLMFFRRWQRLPLAEPKKD